MGGARKNLRGNRSNNDSKLLQCQKSFGYRAPQTARDKSDKRGRNCPCARRDSPDSSERASLGWTSSIWLYRPVAFSAEVSDRLLGRSLGAQFVSLAFNAWRTPSATAQTSGGRSYSSSRRASTSTNPSAMVDFSGPIPSSRRYGRNIRSTMSQSRQDACQTQLDVTPRLTLRCNDWTFLSNNFYFLLVINILLLHYTSHLNDISDAFQKTPAT